MYKVIEIEEFDYTMDVALRDARKYYKKNGNKKEVHEKFYASNLKSLIAYADEYNIKYFDIKLIPSSEKVSWGDRTEEFIDVTFTIQLADEELENEIKKLAEKLYNDFIMCYEKSLENQLETVKWELSRKYKGK